MENRAGCAGAREIDRARAAHFAAEKTIAAGTLSEAYAAKKRMVPFPQAPMWSVLVTCGLRWGEVCTLRWADVDETVKAIRIRAEIAKTKRGRVVPVPKTLFGEILELRRAHVRTLGTLPSPMSPVFMTPRGHVWRQDANGNSGLMLEAILRMAGIPQTDADGRTIDVHALRSSAATRLLRFGVPLTMVSRVLGHRDVKTTMKHYQDLKDGDIAMAVSGVPEIGATTIADAVPTTALRHGT